MAENIRGDIYRHSEDIPYYRFEPWLKERLEWFKDQKFGLFMHWGINAQWGICESWPLVARDHWTRGGAPKWHEYNKDFERFSDAYRRLNTVFNPEYFEPEVWAKLAGSAGMKYVCFTTKHHDGFCMWDTKTTDYRITGPETLFSRNPRSNVAQEIFNAFRNEGLAVWAYFSKSDWHCPYYWAPQFGVYDCSRNPNYDTAKHPEIWEKFVQYTQSQIRELLTDYGKIDCLWLDGGQVRPENGQDIRMDEIAAFARELQPGLLIADRTVGGMHENFITPEQTIPESASEIPWESCITMGNGFAYSFNDTYKSPSQVLRILFEVVCKGGNLLLNVAPSPEGRFDTPPVRTLRSIGDWMAVNGEAIHGTRPIAPYSEGGGEKPVYFTQKNGTVYAIYLAEDGRPDSDLRVMLRAGLRPKKGAEVRMLGYEKEITWEERGDSAVLYLPPVHQRPCDSAWVFHFPTPG